MAQCKGMEKPLSGFAAGFRNLGVDVGKAASPEKPGNWLEPSTEISPRRRTTRQGDSLVLVWIGLGVHVFSVMWR